MLSRALEPLTVGCENLGYSQTLPSTVASHSIHSGKCQQRGAVSSTDVFRMSGFCERTINDNVSVDSLV